MAYRCRSLFVYLVVYILLCKRSVVSFTNWSKPTISWNARVHKSTKQFRRERCGVLVERRPRQRTHYSDPGALFLNSVENDYQENDKSVKTSTKTGRQAPTVWNPGLRKIMGALAAVGSMETGYLTYMKFFGREGITSLYCLNSESGAASCGNILDSSYASMGGIPLTIVGFLAYSTAAVLALYPVTQTDKAHTRSAPNTVPMDSFNRLALLALTTAMATFSVFLMSILFFVMKASCTYCVISAALSLSLALMAWCGGIAEGVGEANGRNFALSGLAAMLIATAAGSGLYQNTPEKEGFPDEFASSTLIVSKLSESNDDSDSDLSPPPIASSSSNDALRLAADLKLLNARFFGAYWCSHCYEQKERMGKEAMHDIPYIECSRDGINSQSALCKERRVPGYPTWEIAGQLFPGEKSLEELEAIVRNVKGV